jgi:hypothetical protein
VAASSLLREPIEVFEPTSLNRGEGLAAGWLGAVGVELGERGRGGGGGRIRESEPKSTMMRLMAVLNSALPHR